MQQVIGDEVTAEVDRLQDVGQLYQGHQGRSIVIIRIIAEHVTLKEGHNLCRCDEDNISSDDVDEQRCHTSVGVHVGRCDVTLLPHCCRLSEAAYEAHVTDGEKKERSEHTETYVEPGKHPVSGRVLGHEPGVAEEDMKGGIRCWTGDTVH